MVRNNSENLILKIEATLDNLRPSEQKVARYVLSNYDEVKYQTVSELASNSNVSEASVMRFIKSLGFKGFQYFKLSLASSTQQRNSSPQVKKITKNDSISDIMNKIKNNSINSINDSETLLKGDEIEKAIKYIKN
ncbi:MAG: MurR/RpiR family transcriptional regulator, partial [Halanaerobiales bacterium]